MRCGANAVGGWALAAAAFFSPLCALSVSLFSARIAQHTVLTLVAAPLIARGMPRAAARNGGWRLWASSFAFFAALWFWGGGQPLGCLFARVGRPMAPRPYNFAVIPTVASRYPLWEGRLGEQATRSTLGRGMLLTDGKQTIGTTGIDAAPEMVQQVRCAASALGTPDGGCRLTLSSDGRGCHSVIE